MKINKDWLFPLFFFFRLVLMNQQRYSESTWVACFPLPSYLISSNLLLCEYFSDYLLWDAGILAPTLQGRKLKQLNMNYFNACFKEAYLELKGDELHPLKSSCLFFPMCKNWLNWGILMPLLPSEVSVRLKNEKKTLTLLPVLSWLWTSLRKYLYPDIFLTGTQRKNLQK